MKLHDSLKQIQGAPKWKLIGFAILVLFAAFYLVWSFVRTPPLPAGAITHPAPAVTAPKVAGPKMSAPLRIVPAKAVLKSFPQIGSIAPREPVIDTAKIPKAENGGSTVTFMNVSTGTASTVFIPAPSPWFALESRNTLGAGYQASTEGTRIPIYYRRDILRVKDVHLLTEVGVKIPVGLGKTEGHIGAAVEWRF